MSISDQTAALLGEDLALWQTMAQDLKTGGHLASFQPSSNNAWAALNTEQKTELMTDMAMLHGQVFGYEVYAPDVYALDLKYRTPGFQCLHSIDDDGEAESDGGLGIPDMPYGKQSLQFLMFGVAGSLINWRVEQSLKADPYAEDVPHAKDIMDFYVQKAGYLWLEENTYVQDFPMADDLEGWLALPSNHYALTVTRMMNEEIFGTSDIDPEVLKVMHNNLVGLQYEFLTMPLSDKNEFPNNSAAFRSKWEERAQKYIAEVFKNPDRHNTKHGLEVLRILKQHDIEFTSPDNLQQILNPAPIKKKQKAPLEIFARKEALDYVGSNSASTFEKLSTQEIMHLIDVIIIGGEMSKKERKLCDVSIQELLSAMPLDEDFLNHYRVIMYEMARDMRKDFIIGALGKAWLQAEDPYLRGDLIGIVGNEMARRLEIEQVPILLFEKGATPKERGDSRTRDALGFATRHADPDSLKATYNADVPKDLIGQPVIGLNIHRDFGLLTGPSPMLVSMVIAHEYGHHLRYQLGKTVLPETDPRFAQQQQFQLTDSHTWIDMRLRNDFSESVYPLIPSEKFEYWLMDEFERCKPFAFLDPK